MTDLFSLILYLFVSTKDNITYSKEQVLASRAISLEKRYNNEFINTVFKKNILLNIGYMKGSVEKNSLIDWDKIQKPFEYSFSLNPNETFAFHDDVLSKYENKVAKTTNAHFNSQEGFLSDGYLVGDGVCHLASIIYWAAKDAGLSTEAPTNHDFMEIPEVPKEYGVSIYNYPGKEDISSMQNLYITNNKEKSITFYFKFDGTNLAVFIFSDDDSSKISYSGI